MSYASSGNPRPAASPRCVLVILAAALIGCGPPRETADAPGPANTPVAILDREEVDELQAAFQEVAGRDQIVFAARSARLDSTSRFQLERQALWLTANEHVAIRLRAEAANPRDVAERRLALRRAESVRSYLKEIGVRGDQVVGIDIDYGKSGAVSTLIDEFRSGEPPARQAVNDIRRGKR